MNIWERIKPDLGIDVRIVAGNGLRDDPLVHKLVPTQERGNP